MEKQQRETDLGAGYNKVKHGIPYDRELQEMTYTQLAVLLASCEKESPLFFVVKREMEKKAITENEQLSHPSQSFWHHKLWHHPIVKTALSIMAVLVAAALLYFFGLR